jgi:phosphoadenosine phosphosulfate reductase
VLSESGLFGARDKVAVALERIRYFERAALAVDGRGYYVCVSGGKDSAVIQELCLLSGVKCVFAHAHTSADYPQTVRFVRGEAERLRRLGYEFVIEVPQGKYVLNPIVDWTDEDVWEFIDKRKLPVNPLYGMGYKRVGCIGCPLNTRGAEELEAYPRYKAAYMRAGGRYLERRREKGSPMAWESAEEYYRWWKYEIRNNGQGSLFEGNKEKPKAEITKQMKVFAAVLEGGKGKKELAEEYGVCVSTIEHAMVVGKRGERELIEGVLEGKTSINKAYRGVRGCGKR